MNMLSEVVISALEVHDEKLENKYVYRNSWDVLERILSKRMNVDVEILECDFNLFTLEFVVKRMRIGSKGWHERK